jgi:hypothetical protein
MFGGSLQAETYLPSSLFTGDHQLLTQGAAFWIMTGRALLIRVRELVSNGIYTGWVGVF